MKSHLPSPFSVTQTPSMDNIDHLIRSLRAWRRHRPDWAQLLDKIEARLRQQSARAKRQLVSGGGDHSKTH